MGFTHVTSTNNSNPDIVHRFVPSQESSCDQWENDYPCLWRLVNTNITQ
jgi:hypothetical protein